MSLLAGGFVTELLSNNGLLGTLLISPLNGVLSVLLDLLEPLGIRLGETDVTLYSVQCGGPRLVH